MSIWRMRTEEWKHSHTWRESDWHAMPPLFSRAILCVQKHLLNPRACKFLFSEEASRIDDDEVQAARKALGLQPSGEEEEFDDELDLTLESDSQIVEATNRLKALQLQHQKLKDEKSRLEVLGK